MTYLHLPLLLLLFAGTMTLNAQQSSFSLTTAVGTSFGTESSVQGRPLASLGVDYERRVGYRFGLVAGLGLQQSAVDVIAADGEPCVFPLGIKVTQFLDGEEYRVRTTEALGRFGATYHGSRVRFGLAVLPAYRLGGRINYQFRRNFTPGNRPDMEINETIRSGETIDRAPVGGGPRSIDVESFRLLGEVSTAYELAPRLSVGLAWRPVVTGGELSYTDQSYCTENVCVDFSGESTPVSALSTDAFLLSLSFGL